MKKFVLGSIALLTILAGTMSIPATVSASAAPAASGSKSNGKAGTVTTAFIPPPTCPPTDPNGCGIYE